MKLGLSPLYNNYPIKVNIDDMFSNHMAIFGNTGSGKSYGVASFVQSLFYNENFNPYRANYMIFDAYGEYHSAFTKLHDKIPEINFKAYTTNLKSTDTEILKNDLLEIPSSRFLLVNISHVLFYTLYITLFQFPRSC